jgi:glycosyltransferase involved in cell wall biosynthesis
MKKIIINCNDCFSAYNFRLGLIKELKNYYEVFVVAKFDKYTPLLQQENIKVITINTDATSLRLRENFQHIREYHRIFKSINPDLIINYTIKPHLYGTLFAPKRCKVINFVSGVGSVFEKRNFFFKIIRCFYRFTSKKVDHYIFLNEDDYMLFSELEILRQPHTILPGEGIDMEKFIPEVNLNKPITFIFIGRLIEEKGIRLYLEAAKIFKRRFPEVNFWVAGDFYRKKTSIKKSELISYETSGIVKYLGYRFDINVILRDVHVVVLPSYREGMPFSLMEGLASKKFLIASDVPGCKDVVVDGYNGFLFRSGSTYDLVLKMEKYLKNDNKEELHNNALTSASKYDQKKIIPEIIGLIQEII